MFLSNLFYTPSKLKKPNLKTKPRLFASTNSLYPIAVWVIAVGLAFYPIYVYPLYHSEKFSKCRVIVKHFDYSVFLFLSILVF